MRFSHEDRPACRDARIKCITDLVDSTKASARQTCSAIHLLGRAYSAHLSAEATEAWDHAGRVERQAKIAAMHAHRAAKRAAEAQRGAQDDCQRYRSSGDCCRSGFSWGLSAAPSPPLAPRKTVPPLSLCRSVPLGCERNCGDLAMRTCTRGDDDFVAGLDLGPRSTRFGLHEDACSRSKSPCFGGWR